MGFFSKLFSSAPVANAEPKGEPEIQAILVYMGEDGLADEVYADYDIHTLSDQLIDIMEPQSLGEYDGEESGVGGTTLFIYSEDAERCFKAIEKTLRAYPLCANARVVIRQGEPGAPQREVRFS